MSYDYMRLSEKKDWKQKKDWILIVTDTAT